MSCIKITDKISIAACSIRTINSKTQLLCTLFELRWVLLILIFVDFTRTFQVSVGLPAGLVTQQPSISEATLQYMSKCITTIHQKYSVINKTKHNKSRAYLVGYFEKTWSILSEIMLHKPNDICYVSSVFIKTAVLRSRLFIFRLIKY